MTLTGTGQPRHLPFEPEDLRGDDLQVSTNPDATVDPDLLATRQDRCTRGDELVEFRLRRVDYRLGCQLPHPREEGAYKRPSPQSVFWEKASSGRAELLSGRPEPRSDPKMRCPPAYVNPACGPSLAV